MSCSSAGQDTDFRPHFLGLDALPLMVHACPRCCFAGYESDFEKVEPAVKRFVLTEELRADEIIGGEEREHLRGSSKYMLAARCRAADPAAREIEVADLYLRAAWCARSENLRDREQQCQSEAVLRFEQALDTGSVEANERPTILYLVGELYRRLGMFDVACDYFDEALHSAEEAGDPHLVALIQQQEQAARAGQSENMVIK